MITQRDIDYFFRELRCQQQLNDDDLLQVAELAAELRFAGVEQDKAIVLARKVVLGRIARGKVGAQRETATPSLLSWQDIAESAYKAYAASTGNKNYRGEPMPAFGDLPASIQIAWEAAARQVRICISHGEAVDEAAWQGWTPPHFGEKT